MENAAKKRDYDLATRLENAVFLIIEKGAESRIREIVVLFLSAEVKREIAGERAGGRAGGCGAPRGIMMHVPTSGSVRSRSHARTRAIKRARARTSPFPRVPTRTKIFSKPYRTVTSHARARAIVSKCSLRCNSILPMPFSLFLSPSATL